MITIRDARPGDAVRLAEIHALSWQTAYRGLLSDEFLDTLGPTSRLDFWTARLARVPPRWAVLVSQVEEEVTGFVTIGHCQDDDRNKPGSGELYAMYLVPEYWGRGHGRKLLLAAEVRFGEYDYADASLWVLRDNRRARRFYELGRWTVDGAEQRMVIGADAVVAVRYVRGFR
jgi:ribosomal protein S18 acetylase RimI-like enzyme